MRFKKLKQQIKSPQKAQNIEKKKYLVPSLSSKIKAFIIDMFMIYAPILYLIAYVFLDGKDAFLASEFAPLIAVALYGFIYATLISRYGHTPGKKAYSLIVLDAKSGEKIEFFRALLRFVGFLLASTIIFGLLISFYRRDKKGLHDLIAGTIEVAEKEAS